MSLTFGLHGRMAALVHPRVSLERMEGARHLVFLSTRLATMLAAFAALPLTIAIGGAPPVAAALGLAALSGQIIAVFYLSRTGTFALAQAISQASLFFFAAIVAWHGASVAATAALLLIAAEAMASSDTRAAIAYGALAIAGMAAIGGLMLISDARAFIVHPAEFIVAAVAGLDMAVIGIAALLARRASDGAVNRATARLAVLTDAIGDLVLRHDASGAVLFASHASETLATLPAADLLGRGFFERVHVADRPTFLKAITDAAISGTTISTILRLRTGSEPSQQGDFDEPIFAFMELRARRLQLETGFDRTTVISVLRDVTRAKHHEEQLETLRVEAERAVQWKDRFLANVSHELRTPLNAIIGFSEMLGNEQLTPREPVKQREYANIIRSSGEHLLSVVNSILDMSKIEAGSFDIVPEPFDVPRLVDSCLDIVRLKAAEGAVEIIRALAPSLEELVADKRACKQILINLLSNAVKFTPAGGSVTISARPEGNSLVFCVADTGIGIEGRDLPRLGDPFYQAKASYDRPYEGTGLGLSVVRGLVGLHSGSMTIESAPRNGTSVTVKLPLDCRQVTRSPGALARIETIARPTQAAQPSVVSTQPVFERTRKSA